MASGVQQAYRNYPMRDPMHIGNFAMESAYVKPGVDLVVMVGARDFGGRLVPRSPEAPDCRIVRIGLDMNSMGRNYPTDLALVGDVKEAIKDLQGSSHRRENGDSEKRAAKK